MSSEKQSPDATADVCEHRIWAIDAAKLDIRCMKCGVSIAAALSAARARGYHERSIENCPACAQPHPWRNTNEEGLTCSYLDDGSPSAATKTAEFICTCPPGHTHTSACNEAFKEHVRVASRRVPLSSWQRSRPAVADFDAMVGQPSTSPAAKNIENLSASAQPPEEVTQVPEEKRNPEDAPDAETLADEYAESKGLVCLIPKPGVDMPSCHEPERMCACDLKAAYLAGHAASHASVAAEIRDLRRRLARAVRWMREFQRTPKYLLSWHDFDSAMEEMRAKRRKRV